MDVKAAADVGRSLMGEVRKRPGSRALWRDIAKAMCDAMLPGHAKLTERLERVQNDYMACGTKIQELQDALRQAKLETAQAWSHSTVNTLQPSAELAKARQHIAGLQEDLRSSVDAFNAQTADRLAEREELEREQAKTAALIADRKAIEASLSQCQVGLRDLQAAVSAHGRRTSAGRARINAALESLKGHRRVEAATVRAYLNDIGSTL